MVVTFNHILISTTDKFLYYIFVLLKCIFSPIVDLALNMQVERLFIELFVHCHFYRNKCSFLPIFKNYTCNACFWISISWELVFIFKDILQHVISEISQNFLSWKFLADCVSMSSVLIFINFILADNLKWITHEKSLQKILKKM